MGHVEGEAINVQQVNLEEAKSSLPALVEAALNGEEVVITKDNQRIVKLTPVRQSKPRPQFGSAKGLIIIADDFDEPLADFDNYMR
jgi:antitoxin (DNA-binding transcriptional repressor) of toxin-antitoxin stability system